MNNIYNFLRPAWQELIREGKENLVFIPFIMLLVSFPASLAINNLCLGFFILSVILYRKKLVWNWKLKIVYDCLDLPTFSNSIVRRIIMLIERISLRFVSLTIFASRYFKPLYSSKLKSYVFENYPSLNLLGSSLDLPNWAKNYDEKMLKSTKNVAWVGVVRYLS